MHVAFLDIATAYSANAPYEGALGGTQAAVCYVGAELARQGIAVTLINQRRESGEVLGVANMPPEVMDDKFVLNTFSHIVFNGRWTEKMVKGLRARCKAKFVGWMHEACFQSPYILPLSEFNGMVFVSEWQKNLNASLVPPTTKACVIGNGIAPGFHDLFAKAPVLAAKSMPPVAVYAGSSKRGLLLLPEIIPLIHAAHPEIQFEIYADTIVANNEDENRSMREKLAKLPGVTHVGAVDQKTLPERFARATYLLSPNAYPETFCIVMAEAMAAGLRIITTARAAIPETTHNFAALMPFLDTNNPDWLPKSVDPTGFAAFANKEIATWQKSDATTKEAALHAQISYAQSHYNWARRAESFRGFLSDCAD